MADDTTFEGTGGAKECMEFIRSVRAYAFTQGKMRDDEWMADYASTRVAGDAGIWYEGLAKETQASWELLRMALMDQYTVASTIGAPSATIPTPAAAAPAPDRTQASSVRSSISLVPTPAASGPNHVPSSPISFDDAFSVPNTLAAPQTATSSVALAPKSPVASSIKSQTPKPPGVDAFSLAQASIRSSSPAPGWNAPSLTVSPPRSTESTMQSSTRRDILGGKPSSGAAFSFDDAFGDSFDFGGASFKPHEDATPAVAGLTSGRVVFDDFSLPHPPVASAKISFDDAFGARASSRPSAASPISFDDAFSVPKTLPASQTLTSFGAPAPRQNTSRQNVLEKGIRKSSIPKEYVRLAGPHPGSSSLSVEEPAPKRSGFHFPGFGRSKTVKKPNKADKNAPPSGPSGLGSSSLSFSAASFNALAETSPGEDNEGVRRITAMGFTREQAVTVLEKHDHNINLALNELLESGPA